ncbi:MAG: glycoside hydrolase family 57 protein [Candidatus Zixiibacteriota bacterium]
MSASEKKRLKIAILWHMHQPFYLNPETERFMMPWVRLHGLKDYLDMPLLAEKYGIKATFNLVPSLLDQIEMYGRGYTDRHMELSRLPARELNLAEKKEMLQTFFSAQHSTMIEPHTRYYQLYRKREGCANNINLAAEIFSASEWRDLQVWSNLAWIDPMFRDEYPINSLFRKGRDYTEEDKNRLFDFEINLLKRIIPTYQRLLAENKIDVSFTPYYHPILPLLIDTDVARQAIAEIDLPRIRFGHPEDARWHIEKSCEKYKSLFGREMSGMWPSEGSVSEAAVKLISEAGIKWIATDEEILLHSKLPPAAAKPSAYHVYGYAGAPEVRIFFRDHGLSDKIGFVYAGWDSERAVSDFMQHLRQLRDQRLDNLDKIIVPIVLDGENAWEYYPEDGHKFLSRLYEELALSDEIDVVSMTDAAADLKPRPIDSLFAGSWINHNFRIWIGHGEDNQAWDLLSEARRTLTGFQLNASDADSDKIARAWKQIYIAEGSDWCWWFGDEHLGAFNAEFDMLFRTHLTSVYKILGLEIPVSLMQPIHRGKLESFISLPESLITPRLDGLLTHYYEWSGAGSYDCLKAGGAMHRVDVYIKAIYFAFDHDNLYIRLDFDDDFDLVGINKCRIVIDFKDIGPRKIDLQGAPPEDKDFAFSFKRLLEIKFSRKALTGSGSGKIQFYVALYSGGELLEKWPFDEPISLELPERDKEIFWQV